MTAPTYTFPRSLRLTSGSQFTGVYKTKVRRKVGPLVIWGRPNDEGHLRLGMAMSRKVGGAVVRNAVKRRVRESVRLMQHDWPCGYDLVVVGLRHEPLHLAEYQRIMFKAVRDLHKAWLKKQESDEPSRSTD